MHGKRSQHLQGVILVLTAAALWGAVGPVAKVAFAEGVKPLEVALWRAMIGWVFFALHAALGRQRGIGRRRPTSSRRGVARRLVVHRSDLPAVVIFALVSVTGFYGSYQLAIRLGGAARAAVLLYTAPAWVAIMAAGFLGERLGLVSILSIVVSMAGVALVSFSRGGGETDRHWAGVLFGLAAGFSYALYYILGRRLLSRYSAPTLFAWILILGGAGLLPFVEVTLPTPRAIAALLFIGFASTYCAYSAYSAGLMRLYSSQASVIATMEPVVAAILAYLVLEERLGTAGYVGAGLVLIGVLLQARYGPGEQRSTEPNPTKGSQRS